MKLTCKTLTIILISILFVFSNAISQQNTKRLSEFELKNGIGPVKTKLKLDKINKKLVEEGKKSYEKKCLLCHKIEGKGMGPEMKNITKKRTPEFIMNIIMNPEENEKRHPEIIKLKSQYRMNMPNMGIKFDEARAILEYLRFIDKN